MTFAQRRNRLTTYFSERVPVIKRRIFVLLHICINSTSQVPVYSFQINMYLHSSRRGPWNQTRIARTVQQSKRTTSVPEFVSTVCSKIDRHITFMYLKSKWWKFTDTDTSRRAYRYLNGVYICVSNLMVIFVIKFSKMYLLPKVTAHFGHSVFSSAAMQYERGIRTCKILRVFI
jgi:hypothetical protein